MANITIIGGLLIAFWTYTRTIEDRKAEQALDYVSAFNEGQMLEARNIVFRVWKDFEFDPDALGLTQSAVNAIVERVIVANDINGPEQGIRTAIINISTFFDSVQLCGFSGVCDDQILKSQLGPYARSFRCLHEDQILRERRQFQLPDLGAGLIRFADEIGTC